MGFQSYDSPNLGNFGTPNFGVVGQNDIWVLAPWPSIENTIRGKVVASPKSSRGECCESVFAHGLSVHQKCFNYTLTNLLFGLCRSVWIIDLLVTYLSSHPRALACPFTPKVLGARECAPIPYPSVVFTLWTCSWIHQGVWGCIILNNMDRKCWWLLGVVNKMNWKMPSYW
jgi:hypothetical protein